MATKLEEILAHTRGRVAERKAGADIAAMEELAHGRVARGFAAALRRAATPGPAIIAELKKASPSKGLLREDFDPAGLARSLEAGGAGALSVLTDDRFFQGSLADLEVVSGAVGIPVLRKDFMVDRFQVLEAKAAGADAILLIVAAHGDRELRELAAEAARWQLDVLCEVHTRDEVERAVQLGFAIIGVNSRNLKTLEVDPQVQSDLARHLPTTALRVAESGVRSRKDIERLRLVGYDAFLVGETLMRAADPGARLAGLRASRVAENAIA